MASVFPAPTSAGQTHYDSDLGNFIAVEISAGSYVWEKDADAANIDWQTIDDSTTTIGSGFYQVGNLTGALAPTVSLASGESVRVWDSLGITATHALTLIPANSHLVYKDPSNGTDFNGIDAVGLILDDPSIYNDIEIVANSDGSYSIDFDPQAISDGELLDIKGTQTGDFTVVDLTATSKEVVYPVDVSASAPNSELNITVPNGASGNRFRITDSTLSCTLTRTIKVNFATDSLMGLAGPGEFAVINSAGASLLFVFVGGTIGWEVYSNVNN